MRFAYHTSEQVAAGTALGTRDDAVAPAVLIVCGRCLHCSAVEVWQGFAVGGGLVRSALWLDSCALSNKRGRGDRACSPSPRAVVGSALWRNVRDAGLAAVLCAWTTTVATGAFSTSLLNVQSPREAGTALSGVQAQTEAGVFVTGAAAQADVRTQQERIVDLSTRVRAVGAGLGCHRTSSRAEKRRAQALTWTACCSAPIPLLRCGRLALATCERACCLHWRPSHQASSASFVWNTWSTPKREEFFASIQGVRCRQDELGSDAGACQGWRRCSTTRAA